MLYPRLEFGTDAWRGAPVAANTDETAVRDLLFACEDYNMLVCGLPVSEDAAREFFVEAPPGKTPGDVVKLGIRSNESPELLALMDLARDYPTSGSWYIGLFLVRPAVQGQGLGGAVVAALCNQLRTHGVTELQCSVVEENQRALKFWLNNGFAIVDRMPPATFGLKTHRRLALRARLAE